jgi:methylmalonyl-CoA mutase C-terminal domain/subunit
MMNMQTMSTSRPIRVLIAKVGLDGHDRGAKVIAHALREAGMEVIYTGLRKSPEAIVKTAVEEDVDAIGLSILSGAHNTLVPRVLELLRQSNAGGIPVLLGGTIPTDDIELLKSAGVAAILGPGTPLADVVERIRACALSARVADGFTK